MYYLLTVLLAVVLFLNGCSMFPPQVQPFAFESVSISTPAQEARFTPLSREQSERYRYEFLKISVTSKTNLAELAKERELNLWVKAWLCNKPSPHFLWTAGELRYQDAAVGYVDVPADERAHVQALLEKVPTDAFKTE